MSPFESEFLPRNVVSVGVQVTWDVFDWGRKKHELAEKERAVRQVRNELQEAEALVALEVESKLMKLREYEGLIGVARAARAASLEELRDAVSKYNTSSILLGDLLQAQARLAAYGVKPSAIDYILAARNINAPGGMLEVGARNVSIDPSGEFKSEREIGDVIISAGEGGAPVYLRDLVEINRALHASGRSL